MLPLLPVLLAQVGVPVLSRALGAALETIPHPVADGAARALQAVQTALADGTIATESVQAANRHIQAMAALDSEDFQTAIQEVNRTIRTEVTADDPFVRRMRPTFGYIMAATWCLQMGAIALVVVMDPKEAGTVINAMASLGTIWTVGLSVLGIYVYKRSEEKLTLPGTIAAGPHELSGSDTGILARLATLLSAARPTPEAAPPPPVTRAAVRR